MIIRGDKLANVTIYLKDGTKRKSLEGYKIPFNDETKDIYDLIKNHKMKGSSKDKTA